MYIEFEADNLPDVVLGALKTFYYPDGIQVERLSFNGKDYYKVTVNNTVVIEFYIHEED